MSRFANTLFIPTSWSTYYCNLTQLIHLLTFKKHVSNSFSFDLFRCANTLFTPTAWSTYYCKRTQLIHLLTFKKHVSNSCSFDLFRCANTLFLLPLPVSHPDQHLTVNTYAFQSHTFTDVKRTFFQIWFSNFKSKKKALSIYNMYCYKSNRQNEILRAFFIEKLFFGSVCKKYEKNMKLYSQNFGKKSFS